ncbi:MAG: 1-acyl-sn-glycerol-3-phosphate acyltransferase [Bacteriovoracaceae bacterium]
MRALISFTILSGIKIFARLFYRFDVNWLTKEEDSWDEIRLIVFLNHTSLFEPLYVGVPPWPFIAKLSRKMVAPGADKTLNRPIVGKFWKFMGPGMISISRKRDRTWKSFMEAIKNRSIIIIAPEGRMKRANGLDLNGNPMTVKSGVADVLEQLYEGKMLVAYSGGLHHVQVPGQKFPNFFKRLKMNLELLDIQDYKAAFNGEGVAWKRAVVADMQERLENNCPKAY